MWGYIYNADNSYTFYVTGADRLTNLNNYDLRHDNSGGPGAASQYYKDNASVTVVTDDGNYVVTVKDWDALRTYFNNYLITHGGSLSSLDFAFATENLSKNDPPAFTFI